MGITVCSLSAIHRRRTAMKLIVLIVIWLFLTAKMVNSPAADAPAAPNAEDAKLAAFFKSYLDAEFRRHPSAATRAGDHRFDDRLDDLSPAAQAADLKAMRDAIDALPRTVNYSALSRAGQIDF